MCSRKILFSIIGVWSTKSIKVITCIMNLQKADTFSKNHCCGIIKRNLSLKVIYILVGIARASQQMSYQINRLKGANQSQNRKKN